MSFTRLLGTLALLLVLSACPAPTPEQNGPRLQDVAQLETTEGAPYEVSLAATGGTPPLYYSLDKVPPGFSFYTGPGLLKGPASVSGQYTFTVQVRDATGAVDTRTYRLLVHPAGTDTGTALAFNVANWNIEWFGDPNNGPTNDTLQLDNVRAVIAEARMDFWGLQELVDATEFNALKQRLPGYDGFMANDSRVMSGAYYYSAGEQKVGILFRSDVVSVQQAELILTGNDYEFAGRPPLRVDLRVTRDGTSVDLVAIVLHMKAFSDSESYERRKSAALLLEDYLDTQLPDARVLVLGDWNDDVDMSIGWNSTSGGYLPTPYQNFLEDSEDYTFVTRPLSLSGQRSTVSHSQFIDHQLASNELLASYENNSARVLKPSISQYGSTTSDHYPVLSRFTFDGVSPELGSSPGMRADGDTF